MNDRVMSERALAVSVPGGKLIGMRSGWGRPLLVLHGGPAVNDYSDWFAAELTGGTRSATHSGALPRR